MNILLVGSGGREHALAWKIAQSPLCDRLVCAPGNPGIASVAECRDVSVTDPSGLLDLAREIDAGLVVIGPESALEKGIADRLAEAGIPCFGPTEAAARLETSKVFSKDFAARHKLPTAEHESFSSAAAAKAHIAGLNRPAPYVIKADGLASGKGVVLAGTKAEAGAAIDEMFAGKFGASGSKVVIEEFMPGEEASLFALCDGETAILFGAAQDHKRAYDGDTGPNTGGMGTYSPAPVLTPDLADQAKRLMIDKTVAGMRAEGSPYRGVIYAGLMLEGGRARLVEFNSRFGDPECQVLMMRLESDIVPYLLAAASGGLKDLPAPVWREEAAICVVMAPKGYPDAPVGGTVIEGAEADFGPDVQVFHAGTSRNEAGELVGGTGRVLNVCARGATLSEARARVYEAIAKIDWPGGFYRSDIGWRELTRA